MVREVTFGALAGAIAWLAWGVLVVILAASGLWFATTGGATRFEIVLQTLRNWVMVFAPGAMLGGVVLGATFAKQCSSRIGLGFAAAATSIIIYSATFLAVFAWGRVRFRAAGYAAEQGMDALLIYRSHTWHHSSTFLDWRVLMGQALSRFNASLAAPWILLAALFGAAAAAEPSSSVPRDAYSVEQLRAWHRSLGNWPWTFAPEQMAKLRSEGPSQLLLCSGGGARSGQYVVFAQQDSKWVPISGQIDQAHHPVRVLEHSVSGWHDFQTFIPLWGSGGKEVMVVTYRWAGDRYEQLSSSQGLWCEYEPFKREAMCRGS